MTIDVDGFVGKVAQASSLYTGKQDACATYVSRTQFAIILAEGKSDEGSSLAILHLRGQRLLAGE